MEVTLPLAAREATRSGPKNLATGPKTGRETWSWGGAARLP